MISPCRRQKFGILRLSATSKALMVVSTSSNKSTAGITATLTQSPQPILRTKPTNTSSWRGCYSFWVAILVTACYHLGGDATLCKVAICPTRRRCLSWSGNLGMEGITATYIEVKQKKSTHYSLHFGRQRRGERRELKMDGEGR